MRLAIRIIATLFLSVAVVWIATYVVVTCEALDPTSPGFLWSVALVPVNVALNAWPALVLILMSLGMARLYGKLSGSRESS